MGINKYKGDIVDLFDEDFEVTYEEDTLLESELNMDAYKDVLSVLNELDDTGSMDYLAANRTRTINLDEDLIASSNTGKHESSSKHKGLSGYFEEIFKKHE